MSISCEERENARAMRSSIQCRPWAVRSKITAWRQGEATAESRRTHGSQGGGANAAVRSGKRDREAPIAVVELEFEGLSATWKWPQAPSAVHVVGSEIIPRAAEIAAAASSSVMPVSSSQGREEETGS